MTWNWALISNMIAFGLFLQSTYDSCYPISIQKSFATLSSTSFVVIISGCATCCYLICKLVEKKLILFFLSFRVLLGTIWFCCYLLHNIFPCFEAFILFHHDFLLIFFTLFYLSTQHSGNQILNSTWNSAVPYNSRNRYTMEAVSSSN